jgi:hypothetical protein
MKRVVILGAGFAGRKHTGRKKPACPAEAAARAVAEDIAARLHGTELERPYDGAGNC